MRKIKFLGNSFTIGGGKRYKNGDILGENDMPNDVFELLLKRGDFEEIKEPVKAINKKVKEEV